MQTDYVIIHRIWNGIEIEIRWQPDYCHFDDGRSMAHLEVESINPKRAPLPITSTGYRSHFIHAADVEIMGGPEAYVDAWIGHLAKSRSWRIADQASRQLALF
jgi:hypothetical protein